MNATETKFSNTSERIFLVAFLFAVVVVCAYVLKFTDAEDYWGDLYNYYRNTSDVIDGNTIYSESRFEYPPLAMLFMLIPRVLTPDEHSFFYAYAVLVYIFLAIGIFFIIKIAKEHDCLLSSCLLLLMTLAAGSYFVITRNDVFPTVFSIIAIYLYLKKKYVPAFVFIGIASMIKLYPAIFLLPMLIPFLAKKDWKNVLVGILAAGLTVLIIELPFMIIDASTAFDYLEYHSDRGIQIESVVASIFETYAVLFSSDIAVTYNYGSDNLTGVAPEWLGHYMNMILAAAMLLFFLVMLYRASKSKFTEEEMNGIVSVSCVAILMIFVLFSKVYSAQYVIWIMMLMFLTMFSGMGFGHKSEIFAISVPFCIFTICSYWAYPELGLVFLDPTAVAATLMKNVFHIILTLEIVHFCIAATSPDRGGRRDEGMFTSAWHHLVNAAHAAGS